MWKVYMRKSLKMLLREAQPEQQEMNIYVPWS